MSEISVTEAKRALRALVRARRTETFSCGDAHSLALIELISQMGLRRVAAFVEFDNEPDLWLLRAWCGENGVSVLLPEIQPDFTLTWSNGAVLAEAQLIVVPALAAGRDGSRLGRGKGYYDRALNGLTAPRIVAVHDEELFDSVPCEEHDLKMDAIVSCSGILRLSDRLK